MKNSPIRAASVLLLAFGLAACGGGDDSTTTTTTTTTTSGGVSGGTLTLSATAPAAYTGDIVAASVETKAEAANMAITVPYCTVEFVGAPGPNGKTYNGKVYFLQGATPTPVNLSIGEEPTYAWGVNDFNVAGVSGVTVDLAGKTISISNKAMTGTDMNGDPDPAQSATVNGSIAFPAVAGCGA